MRDGISTAASVRPWPCPTCHSLAGEPCRARITYRVTDTHAARQTRPAGDDREDEA